MKKADEGLWLGEVEKPKDRNVRFCHLLIFTDPKKLARLTPEKKAHRLRRFERLKTLIINFCNKNEHGIELDTCRSFEKQSPGSNNCIPLSVYNGLLALDINPIKKDHFLSQARSLAQKNGVQSKEMGQIRDFFPKGNLFGLNEKEGCSNLEGFFKGWKDKNSFAILAHKKHAQVYLPIKNPTLDLFAVAIDALDSCPRKVPVTLDQFLQYLALRGIEDNNTFEAVIFEYLPPEMNQQTQDDVRHIIE